MHTFYVLVLWLLLLVCGSKAQVAINEFMFNPHDVKNEWVELYNPTTSAVNLNGWTIKDIANNAQPLYGSIAAKSYLILARDTQALFASYPNLTTDCVIKVSLRLNQGITEGDSIIISKEDGKPVDALLYRSKWGKEKGRSLERKRVDMPASDSANWSPSKATEGATPCYANSYPLSISFDNSSTVWLLHYNCSNQVIKVMWNESETPISIATFTLVGKIERAVTPVIGSNAAEFPATTSELRIIVGTWKNGEQKSQLISCY